MKDPRGNETDMQYDANGNLVAVAAPSATSSGSNFRSTTLISYDSNNNPTAICDPAWSHTNGHDWTATPAPSDSLCPASSSNARIAYTTPSYEPYGEVSTVTSPSTASAPSGYTRTLSYPSSGDQGMPISIAGTSFTQADSSNWTPTTQISYDPAGNPICYNAGNGWYVMQYDSMGRMTAVGDPDDKSLSGCSKTNGQYTTASYVQYYPNGQVTVQPRVAALQRQRRKRVPLSASRAERLATADVYVRCARRHGRRQEPEFQRLAEGLHA